MADVDCSLRVVVNQINEHYCYQKLPGERDNARICQVHAGGEDQSSESTHGLDGQHQYVDRIPNGRVSQNDRGQR